MLIYQEMLMLDKFVWAILQNAYLTHRLHGAAEAYILWCIMFYTFAVSYHWHLGTGARFLGKYIVNSEKEGKNKNHIRCLAQEKLSILLFRELARECILSTFRNCLILTFLD